MRPDQLSALLSRAAHPATPEEEARTSAVILCRAIVADRWELCPTGTTESLKKKAAPPTPRPSQPRRPTNGGPVQTIKISAKFAGACRTCGVRHDAGDVIAWRKGAGTWCLDCFEQREAAA